VTVSQEEDANDSVLAFYRRLLKLKQTALFTRGKEQLLATRPSVYAYRRQLAGQLAVVAVNLAAAPATIAVTSTRTVLAVGTVSREAHQLTLGAYAGVVVTEEEEK
jgi:glycosidase